MHEIQGLETLGLTTWVPPLSARTQDRTLRTTWALEDGQRPLRSEHAWVPSLCGRRHRKSPGSHFAHARSAGPGAGTAGHPAHTRRVTLVRRATSASRLFLDLHHDSMVYPAQPPCLGAQVPKELGCRRAARASSHPPQARPCLPSDGSIHPCFLQRTGSLVLR